MKTKRNAKRALVLSCLSLVLCLTMLVGSTFAWFTDNATTKVNKIESGTLDIILEYWNGESWENAEGKTLDFVKAPFSVDQNILWEPGATYNLPQLRIRNNGNLALLFEVILNNVQGNAKLNNAIDWTYNYSVDYDNDWNGIIDANERFEAFDSLYDKLAGGWALLPEGSEGVRIGAGVSYYYLDISGHMREDAGNEYQGLTIDGASVTLTAKQMPYEFDSTTNLYDLDAQYKDPGVTITKGSITLESGKTLTIGGGKVDDYKLIESSGDGIVIDNITFTGTAIVWGSGSTVTINGGTFTATAIAVKDAVCAPVVINGGTFHVDSIDASTGVSVTINGGTFDCDPSGFVADDRTVTNNGDGTWTVS